MNNLLKKIRYHWKPIIFSISIILFIYIAKLLLKDQISTFDQTIYNIITYFKNDYITIFFKIITFFCSIWFIILTNILIILFYKKRKASLYISLNVLICFLLNQTAKIIFARTRPTGINIITENGYSFPSGHSMVSLAFYGFLIYLIVHTRWRKKKKLILTSLLSLLIILIGISRIYLGVHYASDVIAGYALSMAYLVIYIKLFYKKMDF